jgi:hypothetical protein
MALTRTPSLPSFRRQRPREAQHAVLGSRVGAEFGQLTCTNDWIEPILTIRPLVCAHLVEEGWCDVEHAVEVDRQDVVPVLGTQRRSPVIGLRRLMPALLTRIEMLPVLAISAAAALHACAVGHVDRDRRRLAARRS